MLQRTVLLKKVPMMAARDLIHTPDVERQLTVCFFLVLLYSLLLRVKGKVMGACVWMAT